MEVSFQLKFWLHHNISAIRQFNKLFCKTSELILYLTLGYKFMLLMIINPDLLHQFKLTLSAHVKTAIITPKSNDMYFSYLIHYKVSENLK